MPITEKHGVASTLGDILANASDLVTEKEAAQILNISPGTLSVWRSTGRHALPFVKVGGSVRYSRKGLELWLAARTRTSGATV